VTFGECGANVFFTLLRPKQREESSDILDPTSNRRTERDFAGHDNKAIMRICGMAVDRKVA
jgi:hypothetical protein